MVVLLLCKEVQVIKVADMLCLHSKPVTRTVYTTLDKYTNIRTAYNGFWILYCSLINMTDRHYIVIFVAIYYKQPQDRTVVSEFNQTFLPIIINI
jgi:hypothetical protein